MVTLWYSIDHYLVFHIQLLRLSPTTFGVCKKTAPYTHKTKMEDILIEISVNATTYHHYNEENGSIYTQYAWR